MKYPRVYLTNCPLCGRLVTISTSRIEPHDKLVVGCIPDAYFGVKDHSRPDPCPASGKNIDLLSIDDLIAS